MIGDFDSLRFGNIGSRWLPVTLTAVMILSLVVWLLRALHEAQEMAEKTVIEVTVRNMRIGMQLAMGEAMMHGREAEIRNWAGSNPLQWLGVVPEGYRGECTAAESDALPAGGWCFDRQRRELAYAPRNATHLKLRSGSDLPHLRWRVVAVAPQENGQTGLRVENVTPYEWFLE